MREGGCLCRAIRYKLAGEPEWVWQCFCRECQLATGTGHTTIAGFHRDNIELSGNPRQFTTTGDTGGSVIRHFCEVCGSRLFTTGDLPGPIHIFQVGALDDPGSVHPTAAIYVKNRIGWDHIDPSLPQYEAMFPSYS